MEEAVRVDNLKNLAAFHTLDEDLDIPVGKLKTLDYVDDGADLIDLIRLGLIYAGVVLRSEKDFSIAGKRLFRPTTNGVIICGKMTTSRIGIMGSLRVSNFSLAWVTRSPRTPKNLACKPRT